jgi:hypothetical protein
VWVVAAAYFVVGCAGSAVKARELHDRGFDLRFGPIPPTWRPLKHPDLLVAFRDDPHQATVAVGGRCGKDGDDVPLQALTQHLFLYFTNREVRSERTLQLDGREALRTELAAKLDGVPMRFTVVVLKKNGCVYDFTYIEDSSGSDLGRSQFDQFFSGFATLGKR